MNIPLDEVVYFDVITGDSTGAATDADSAPTFEVFEEATDTDIGVGGNMTKRTSKTGNYRLTFTASTANGFEVGKWYNVIGSATVDGVAGKAVVKTFRVVAAEATVGVGPATLSSAERDSLATALLDLPGGVEVGLTFRQAMRLIAAAEAGKLSGAGTLTITIRNAVADSKNRITASGDGFGNRTAITYDLT